MISSALELNYFPSADYYILIELFARGDLSDPVAKIYWNSKVGSVTLPIEVKSWFSSILII